MDCGLTRMVTGGGVGEMVRDGYWGCERAVGCERRKTLGDTHKAEGEFPFLLCCFFEDGHKD